MVLTRGQSQTDVPTGGSSIPRTPPRTNQGGLNRSPSENPPPDNPNRQPHPNNAGPSNANTAAPPRENYQIAAGREIAVRIANLDEREMELNRRVEQLNRRERELEARVTQNQQQQEMRADAIVHNENNVRQANHGNHHIRLPPFSTSDTEMWFAQAEAVFDRHRIESELAKVQVMVAQVDSESLRCVRHLVMANPKPENVYTQIKNELISHFAISRESRVLQMIRGDVLISGKPSQMLSRLRSLNTGECTDEVLKAVFISKLPHQHQLALASCNQLPLNELAEKADSMADIDKLATIQNAAIDKEAPPAPTTDKIEVLAAEIASLKAEFEKTTNRKSRDPKRNDQENSNDNFNNNYNNRGRGRSRPYNHGYNNYRGRSRGRGYRGNNFRRGFNPRYNQSNRSYSQDRFRHSSPHDCNPQDCNPQTECRHRSTSESRFSNSNSNCCNHNESGN